MFEQNKRELLCKIHAIYPQLEEANMALFKTKTTECERKVRLLEEQLNGLIDELIAYECD
ncbi:MAG: hypothetical protein RLZZ457_316 [Pseudomonadota bacterium]|jgi:hypothetical protein